MPTLYKLFTQNRAVQAFVEKVDRKIGVIHVEEPPERPEAIIHTKNGDHVWVEETCVFSDEKTAEFFNKFGLYNPDNPPYIESPEIKYSVPQLNEKIRERIQEKESKEVYAPLVKDFGKGILIIYMDNSLFSSEDLDEVMKGIDLSNFSLKKFHTVYLYIPSASYAWGGEIKHIGGLYPLIGGEIYA